MPLFWGGGGAITHRKLWRTLKMIKKRPFKSQPLHNYISDPKLADLINGLFSNFTASALRKEKEKKKKHSQAIRKICCFPTRETNTRHNFAPSLSLPPLSLWHMLWVFSCHIFFCFFCFKKKATAHDWPSSPRNPERDQRACKHQTEALLYSRAIRIIVEKPSADIKHRRVCEGPKCTQSVPQYLFQHGGWVKGGHTTVYLYLSCFVFYFPPLPGWHSSLKLRASRRQYESFKGGLF